ncbi:DUF4469 domain-containing protein [Parabacteroides sp.]
MAIGKTILTVDLYDNVLTEKLGDYSGKIRITGTFRNKEVSAGIVEERTEYRPETIENILGMSDDKKLQALAAGKCVSDGLGHFFLNVGGSFSGKKSDYKSPDNKIGVTFIPSAALLKLLENIYVNADIASVGPMIEHITDSTTGAVDSILTPSAPAVISGRTLLLKGNDPSVGVYFTPESGSDPIKVPLVVTNTTSQIIVSIPALADGNYYLSVTTQAGAGYSIVKEPRTYRLPILLTVGNTGGEEERPGEL